MSALSIICFVFFYCFLLQGTQGYSNGRSRSARSPQSNVYYVT